MGEKMSAEILIYTMKFMTKEKLTISDWRVFAYLLDKLDSEIYRKFDRKLAAQELGIRVDAVGISLRRLVGLGVLSFGPKIGFHNTYKLSLKDPNPKKRFFDVLREHACQA